MESNWGVVKELRQRIAARGASGRELGRLFRRRSAAARAMRTVRRTTHLALPRVRLPIVGDLGLLGGISCRRGCKSKRSVCWRPSTQVFRHSSVQDLLDQAPPGVDVGGHQPNVGVEGVLLYEQIETFSPAISCGVRLRRVREVLHRPFRARSGRVPTELLAEFFRELVELLAPIIQR